MSAYADIETAISEAVKALLVANVAEAFQLDCPVVTFYDPMSIDEANRCVVQVPECHPVQEHAGNFEATVEVGIKAQWAQASVAEDLASHNARCRAFRSVLLSNTLAEEIEAQAGGKFSVWFVDPEKQMRTEVRENWYYSPTIFKIQGGFLEAE